jgi:Fur family transcriptional regulator, ferric uptake regulator
MSNETEYHRMTSAQRSAIARTFERAGYQPTPSRQLVAELVAGRSGPFSAAELLDAARGRRATVGRATVFRALELLSSLNVVERFVLPDGSMGYVACDPEAHHHHLVCTACGRGVDIADGDLGRLVDEIGRRNGYRIESHRLELFGVCPACRGAGDSAAASPAPAGEAHR